jgi:hypothetical protein
MYSGTLHKLKRDILVRCTKKEELLLDFLKNLLHDLTNKRFIVILLQPFHYY